MPANLVVLLLLTLLAAPAFGQGEEPATPAEPTDAETPAPSPEPTRLEPVVVHGREDSLVGVADSASQGTIGAAQLEQRPISRPGEVLEAVPGLIVTQHSGAGKANQFFLRGFNLDHGTDFATFIDGVPVNLPTHGHGQGYTDLNFVIPELVERVDYKKGPYFADVGDFSSAGAAEMEYFHELPQAIAQFEAGMFQYQRALLADSRPLADGKLLYALELLHDDGPWEEADHYRKINGVLRYTLGDAARGATVTASAYAGKWDSTDQIAERALALPGFDRFDSLDDSDGGDSQKYMLYGEWHDRGEDTATKLSAYVFYQDLDLFSNFTYFLDSPQGDQFQQFDTRWVGGGQARRTWFGQLAGREMENSAGLQLRSDTIDNGLLQTVRREVTDKLDYDGNLIPGTTRRDHTWETSVAPYLENRIQWCDVFRSTAGVRLDWFRFAVDADQPGGTGTENKALVSPKLDLVLGPFAKTELYLSGGLGYHSNDARGVTAHKDLTATPPVKPADPLVRTTGAEVGVRSSYFPGLNSSVALWWLDIDSELVFAGDAGTTEPSRPSRRYGVELANYWSPTEWLTIDADYSWSHARFRDHDPAGDYIPGSVENVVAAGAALHDLPWLRGLGAELRLRYFGSRALIEDDSVRSGDTVLLNARLSYEVHPGWTLSLEGFNLLNRDDSEIDYYYASRLQGEPAGPDDGGYNDIHFHPVYPISVRGALTVRF